MSHPLGPARPTTPTPPTPAVRRIPPALVVAAASGLGAATAFVVNILTARALGPELRGHVALVLQAAYFLGPVMVLGADRGALKRRGQGAPPPLALVIGLAAALALVMGAAFAPFVWLAVPAALASAFLALRRASALTAEGIGQFAGPFVLYQAGVLVSSAALFAAGVTWWPAWALPYALPCLVLLPRSLRHRPRGARTPWGENLRLLAAQLAQLVTTRSQRLILPAVVDPAALGLFVVVATATEPIFWLAQAIADQRTGTGARQPRPELRAVCAALARDCVVFVPLTALSAAALWLALTPVFGEEFEAARPLILPLSIAGLALALYRQAAGWLMATTSHHLLMRSEIVIATTAASVYFIAIAKWGSDGAAWASIAIYLLALVLSMSLYIHHNRTFVGSRHEDHVHSSTLLLPGDSGGGPDRTSSRDGWHVMGTRSPSSPPGKGRTAATDIPSGGCR